MTSRKKIPPSTETDVLIKSNRRCPICYFHDGDYSAKKGQVAHLDQNPTNNQENNLAFMCMTHHSDYDSTTSQHKNYTLSEMIVLRDKLYAAIAAGEHHQTLSGGGMGGNAKVMGNGVAIGGSGGRGGKYGQGGKGGSAELTGDGLAVGGEGGSVDSDNVWYAPARSGYEIAREQLGQPIDPQMRKYGRGGMSPEYLARYNVVENIRLEYFKNNSLNYIDAIENVAAVPLDYVNQYLAELGHNWRARIVKLDYEFYIPPEPN